MIRNSQQLSDILLPSPPPPAVDRFTYATVSSVNPLQVVVDGSLFPADASPVNLAGSGFFVGEQVWCQFHGSALMVLQRGPLSANLVGSVLSNGRSMISGGGVRTVGVNSVSWSRRFLMMGVGRSALAPSGFFDVALPPDGTVIPRIGIAGGDSTVAVAAGAIPMSNWDTLYYAPPFKSASTSVPDNFRIVGYTGLADVPSNWIPIVHRNGDTESIPWHWIDGKEQDYWRPATLLNGWVNYGAGFSPAGYYRENGRVWLEGLIKSGTTTAGTIVMQLPVGFRPGAQKILLGAGSLSPYAARLDAKPNGDVITGAAFSDGFTSLDDANFRLES